MPDQIISTSSSLVVGWTDDDWRVTQISSQVTGVLGYEPELVTGSSLLEHVHPDHIPDFVAAAQRVRSARVCHALRLKARHAQGRWVCMPMLLFPHGERDEGLGFVLGDSPVFDAAVEARRSAELEQRLWRIAQEIRAAGLITPERDQPDLSEAILSRTEFTVRQWEVIGLLRDGMRVGSIASTLHVSHSTVRNHLSAIFRKVGVHSQEGLLLVLRGAVVVK